MSQQDNLDPDVLSRLERLEAVPPRDPGKAARGRERFLAEAAALREPVRRSWRTRLAGWWAAAFPRQRPVRLAAAALGVIVLLLGGHYATRRALPGDWLYPLKAASEDTQLALSQDTLNDVQLQLDFTQRRVDEITTLAAQEDYEELETAVAEFEDEIQKVRETVVNLTETDPAQAAIALQLLEESFAAYHDSLSDLTGVLPPRAVPDIERAIQAALDGSLPVAEIPGDSITQGDEEEDEEPAAASNDDDDDGGGVTVSEPEPTSEPVITSPGGPTPTPEDPKDEEPYPYPAP